MSRKTILVAAPLGLGALVLLWAAMTARGEPEPKPVRHASKAVPPKPRGLVEAPAPVAEAPAPSAPVVLTGEYPAIEERIRLMELKLLALETKKAEILASNEDLERQVMERQSEHTFRGTAEWRVRQWDQLLSLTEAQRQSLIDLCMKWAREDAGRIPTRETWLRREEDLRARFSVEQASRLHESAAKQSQSLWAMLGRSLGSMVGASKEEITRFQQTLGDWRAPGGMLLPEGHGADWFGLMKEGTNRLQPVLTPEQTAKLSQHQRWIR